METEEQRTRRIFVDQSEKRLFKNIRKVQEGKDDNVTKERFLTLIREQVDKSFYLPCNETINIGVMRI